MANHMLTNHPPLKMRDNVLQVIGVELITFRLTRLDTISEHIRIIEEKCVCEFVLFTFQNAAHSTYKSVDHRQKFRRSVHAQVPH